MTLRAGEKLGPYEILGPLGAGGMGVVYRARDARLGRDVAVKVASDRFSDRFEREARAVAALNHPNICHLYDVGPNYLVMELVDGQAPRGPLPVEEALRLAKQIANALSAAHEKGIVHRDLKPANIKVRADGTVKVLDFGLARVTSASGSDAENSPTRTAHDTQAGVVLGTPAYMAPERAGGKSVDKRADIWAFGVVLYELLTGERPFRGDDGRRPEPPLHTSPGSSHGHSAARHRRGGVSVLFTGWALDRLPRPKHSQQDFGGWRFSCSNRGCRWDSGGRQLGRG